MEYPQSIAKVPEGKQVFDFMPEFFKAPSYEVYVEEGKVLLALASRDDPNVEYIFELRERYVDPG